MVSAEQCWSCVFDPATQVRVGIAPGVTQAVSAASGVWDKTSSQLEANQLARCKLTKVQVQQASDLNNVSLNTQQWLAPTQPHLQRLAAASSAGTSLEANLKHITVTQATWDAVWEVYQDPKKPPAGQVDHRLLRPAWSQQRDQPVPGSGGPNVVQPPQAPTAPMQPGSHTASSLRAWAQHSPPAKRSKHTMVVQAAETTQPTKGTGEGKGNAAKAKPTPQPGRWLDTDCNAGLNMQPIGERRWRPLDPDQAALPAMGREYPGLGYKRLRDKPPKAQQQLLRHSQQTAPAISQRDMQHQAAVDGSASATDGYSPAGEAPPPATRLLDLPPALLDDIACRVMQLRARSQLPLTCRVFSQVRLLHIPALRIQLGRQCSDQLLMPRVVSALQARTSKLTLTLCQPETKYTKHYTDLLARALTKLDNCAAVEVCKLVSSGTYKPNKIKHLRCSPGLARDLLRSFPSLTALTLQGLCVSSKALASMLSHPPLALQLQQLDITETSVPAGEEPRAVGLTFQGLQLKQLSIAAVDPKQPSTPLLPSFQPLAQHLTQLHLESQCGPDIHVGYFMESLQPLAQLQVLTISNINWLVGLTEVLQALPQLHTLQLPGVRVEGQYQVEKLLEATQLTSLQLYAFDELGTLRADAPCSWQRLELTGTTDWDTLTCLPLHSLSQPLVLEGLYISDQCGEEDSDQYIPHSEEAEAIKVPVKITRLLLLTQSQKQCALWDDNSITKERLARQQRVGLARQLSLLQTLQSFCVAKVVVCELHEFTAADVVALAPLCRECTHLRLYSGSMEPSLEFWRQLVQLMPAVQEVEFFNVNGSTSSAMHKSLQRMANQPWARWLDITIHTNPITAPVPSWQAGSWGKAGTFKVTVLPCWET
ncbi:hypothetical protein QJQ45_000123 [Haematococcus lacustris]|nr:hypothetical protein QJQ45_000123 [Haematococcus lacustris]